MGRSCRFPDLRCECKVLEKGGCLGVLVASDREPGLGLFRCAKIRKSKYA